MDRRFGRFGLRRRVTGYARFSSRKGHRARRDGNRFRGSGPRSHARVRTRAFLDHLKAVSARRVCGTHDELSADWCRKIFTGVNEVVEVVDDPASILAEPAVKASTH